MRRINRYAKGIALITGHSDYLQGLSWIVNKYRKPADTLDSIAVRLGVERVERLLLPFDGGTFDIEGKLVIRLNSHVSPHRQRFTLAHELGHLILAEQVKAVLGCADDAMLERTCDDLAAELLMPLTELSDFPGLRPQTPSAVRALSLNFDVSLQSIAVRLHQLKLWKRPIGMWRIDGDAREVWFVGKRPWDSCTQQFDAFQAAPCTSIAVQTREYCSISRGVLSVSVHALHVGKNHVLATIGE
jgi:Zn-dependent peptidase ImmA (M78 family)